MRAQGLARLVSRLEGVVEAGLTEYTDVIDVAREIASLSPRVRIETPERPMLATLNRVAALRILEELVENGLEFSDEKEHVTVRSTRPWPGSRFASSTTGPASRRTRSSGSSNRSSRPRTCTPGPIKGVGLGLTVARMSARAMDGDVTLEDTGPQGSVFLWRVSMSPFARRDYLKRRMCTFSRIPTPMQLASMELPP